MATEADVTQQPWQWITKLVAFSLCFTVQCFILKYELKRSKNETFPTRWFKLFSLTCIISGVIGTFFLSLQFIAGLCIAGEYIGYIFIFTQSISMGFYQLHRLHYCFSNKQIHSKQAYPKCLFVIMFSIGIILMLNSIFSIVIFGGNIRLNCGINQSNQFYYDKIENQPGLAPLEPLSALMFVAGTFMYQLWDIITLILYIGQIIKFRKHKTSEPTVYKSVMTTLYKIVVLTLFYQLFVLLILILLLGVDPTNPELGDALNAVAGAGSSFAVSYAMHLMMDYNKAKYISFTKVLHRISLYWIFCFCCRGFISDQLKDDIQSLEEGLTKDDDDDNNNDENKKDLDRSVYDTQTAHDDYGANTENAVELSLETATMNIPSNS